MVSGDDEDSQLARALAGGKPHPTGWFRLYFEDERWEWSPEVEQLHGYEPGTAQPTTSMVLSHKHPEDYEQVAATLDDIRRTLSRSAPATASSTSRAAPMTTSWSPNTYATRAAK
jgi:hypothetical protein